MSEHGAAMNDDGGFTLVELLVAMLVTAIVSTVIFALFDTTSSALYEAESLARSVDTARFALERVRGDMKQAGAFGTPDSGFDPRVRPEPGTARSTANYRVAGIVPYVGWQDYAGDNPDYDKADHEKIMPSDIRSQAELRENGELLPNFDGIVLIGAFDYPFQFEVGELTNSSVTVFDHPRGLDKLQKRNLLDLTEPEEAFTGNNPAEVIDDQGRILRIRDPSGYYQFFGVDSYAASSSDLLINLAKTPFFKPAGNQDLKYGFPPRTQQDAGERYYASLLDVYWYHVIRDPSNDSDDERNFQLVRHRLDDGWDVVQALEDWQNFDPHTADWMSDYTVVANRVVDFQIWFDCTTDRDGTIENAAWNAEWRPPDGTDEAAHDCMNPPTGNTTSTQPETVNARMAHVRLSIRTEDERQELTKDAFPDSGALGNHETLEAIDIYPNNPGKARVYTVQSDFELMNHAVRNLTAGVSTTSTN